MFSQKLSWKLVFGILLLPACLGLQTSKAVAKDRVDVFLTRENGESTTTSSQLITNSDSLLEGYSNKEAEEILLAGGGYYHQNDDCYGRSGRYYRRYPRTRYYNKPVRYRRYSYPKYYYYRNNRGRYDYHKVDDYRGRYPRHHRYYNGGHDSHYEYDH